LDLQEVSRREKRQTFLVALVLALSVSVAAVPVVQAAVTKITGTVKVKDSSGDALDSKTVPGGGGQGALAQGALAVRTVGGGGGLIANGDCDGDDTDGKASVRTVAASADTVITAVILAGPGVTLNTTAPGLEPVTGPGPVLGLQTTASNPTVSLALGNGLQVTPAPLRFECTGGAGDWVLLGQLGS
jgi:hypothetical protein